MPKNQLKKVKVENNQAIEIFFCYILVVRENRKQFLFIKTSINSSSKDEVQTSKY